MKMSKRARKVGTYRSTEGKTYSKFKDDENYVYLMVNDQYISIEGDGYKESAESIQKQIDSAIKTI